MQCKIKQTNDHSKHVMAVTNHLTTNDQIINHNHESLRPLQKFMFMFGGTQSFMDLQPIFGLQLQHILRVHFRVCRQIVDIYNKKK